MEVQPYQPLLMVIDHHDNSHKNAYLDPKCHPPSKCLRDELMWLLDHFSGHVKLVHIHRK